MNLPGRKYYFARTSGIFLFFTVLLCLTSNVAKSQTQTKWVGITSQWKSTANWSTNALPSPTLSALISDTGQAPYIPSDTADVKNLEMQHGGELFFAPNGVLKIHGTRLDIQPGSAIYLGNGKLISQGSLTFFSSGTFDAGSGTLEFSGLSWESKSGSTFDPGTSTVIFNGTGSQTLSIDPAANFSFNNLEVDAGVTLSISGDLVISGNCVLDPNASVAIDSGSSLVITGTFSGDPEQITGGGDAVLPVQLSSFTASANRLDAELHWSTASEVNNYGFQIERRAMRIDPSGNPSPSWTTIAFVQGSGTSTIPREYSFTDNVSAPGRYAYRLKQIDFDGTFAYSAAAEVEIGLAPKELALGSNYPNPFNPTTNIEFTVPEAGRTVVRVFNMIGQEVATLFDGLAEGGRIYKVTFTGSSLPSGLYFYRLEHGNQSSVKRMMLVK